MAARAICSASDSLSINNGFLGGIGYPL